ncbi:efflux RND transporter periplasmic adaptor subunit [Rhizobium halophilum]|uniref:efflux RND transporter periplasmic adaptor subunit n=1 Tax=Rhizobium halophilum TaxID=2846852 RepID=UPI001EFCC9BA|nr:efflux RND transporter periplasmic adaptor subunit [Rhizobium halophilum]MCF6368615.1 efflux RND transporter periplasmic adaptor subunit [Rhizobium halophilum]
MERNKAAPVPDLAAILASQGRKPRARRLSWVLALVLLVGGGIGGYVYIRESGPSYTYTTRPIERGNLQVIVTATGSVQPTDQVDISSELSGTIRTVHVTYNSLVKSGDVLAELDTNKLQADVENARAQLASTRANLLKAETDVASTKLTFDRLTGLAERNITSQQDLDAARFAHQAAVAAKAVSEASVQSAEASLRLAEVSLGKSKIISPIDGVILTRDVEPGQTVASSLNAPVLFTIAGDLRQMELQVAVDEADVGQVREGQEAKFSVDAYPDQDFPAEIQTIRYASETVSNVVTYKAILSVENDDLLLRPGMTATADITVQSVEDALLVPNAALRYEPPASARRSSGSILTRLFRPPRRAGDRQSAGNGSDRSVWVLRNGAPQQVDVEAGPSDGQSTVVRSGEIEEGDLVVTDAIARSG